MKQSLQFLLLKATVILVCLCSIPAYAQETEGENIRFTVNIPAAEAVTCQVMGIDRPLVDGTNEFELPETTSLYFAPIYPWKFISVKDKAGKKPSGFYGSDWYLYVEPSIRDEEFIIEMVDINDLRTSRFTINVDDPSLVSAVMTGYDTVLDLNPGENTVRYQQNVETYLNLTPTDNSTPFYSVRLNGTNVAPQGLTYGIRLTNDCVIDVTAILPEEDRTVTFSYSNGAENSISILINGEAPDRMDGNTLAVRLGATLTIQGKNNYKFNNVTVNGQPIEFYGTYSFPVMKDTQVYIDAKPYDTVPVTVVVNDPELITITNNGDNLDLTPGENLIDLSEVNTTISWTVAPTAILNSVTVNGGDPLPAYPNSYTLQQRDMISFDLTEKAFDLEAIVWIDDMSGKACSNYLDFNSTADQSIHYSLDDGYNIVNFYQAMNPFIVGWGGHDSDGQDVSLAGKAYLNGSQLLSTDGENSAFHFVQLADGDVLKLFMGTDPEVCEVGFEISEEIEVTVTKDVIASVTNPAEGFECFAGTQVSVSGSDIKVTVNGKEIEGVSGEASDTETVCTFIVEDSKTTVSVTDINDSGVAMNSSDNDTDIYNMQGVKVGTNDDLRGLAPGIYITGRRKVSVVE